MNTRNLQIHGLPPGIPERIAAPQRSLILGAVNKLMDAAGSDLRITVWNAAAAEQPEHTGKEHSTLLERALPTPPEQQQHYQAIFPRYTFDQLVLPNAVMEDLLAAIEVIRVEPLVFGTWGLSAIEPFPRTALNFYGPPGTGKTLAAHAIAHYLGRTILCASYADIESKYHGDGPKNVVAVFQAAQRDNAVLFIDEADSLLSRRLTSVNQGSEQAINSMRSQLLLSLEQFRGVAIFATNLVQNYDQAFETRVRHIRFTLPDEAARYAIWHKHLPPQLPLDNDVSVEQLAADVTDICGRDIKHAVIDAAVRSAWRGQNLVTYNDLVAAIKRIKAARVQPFRGLTAEEADSTGLRLERHISDQSRP
ncbi:MAG: hypothetical protein OHK0022_26360 [Roseiflexaceae bacterium]